MTTSEATGSGTPDLKRLLGVLLRKHYAMAADEHKESASAESVRRHYDESNAAEAELITALDLLADRHNALVVALRAAKTEALCHYEHNPVNGKDRLPLGYQAIINVIDNALRAYAAALNPQTKEKNP